MHDELKQAIAKIYRVAEETNKTSGIYATSGNQARECTNQGFQMVSVATDATSLPAYLEFARTTARGSYVHSPSNMAKVVLRGFQNGDLACYYHVHRKRNIDNAWRSMTAIQAWPSASSMRLSRSFSLNRCMSLRASVAMSGFE